MMSDETVPEVAPVVTPEPARVAPKINVRRVSATPRAIEAAPTTQAPQVTPEAIASTELADLRAQLNALSTSLQTRAEREQDAERLRYVKAQGLAVQMDDDDLRAILPKVDISTPAGRAKLEEWRQKRPQMFRARSLSDAEVAQLAKPRLDGMKSTKLVSKDAILRRMGGG
jgi:hypothetical protein